MEALVNVDAGVCGFMTTIKAKSGDGQMVAFDMESGCEKITALARLLAEKCAVDAFQEISPVAESVILSTARITNKGCCSGCVVPPAIFKAMQVAAGLALPQDVTMRIAKE